MNTSIEFDFENSFDYRIIDNLEITNKVLKIQNNLNDSLKNIDKTVIEKLVSFLDLTSLNTTDLEEDIIQLCTKATNPLCENNIIKTAAICVYPINIQIAKKALKDDNVALVSVGAGFPFGLIPLSVKLYEIKNIIQNGATEIDIVINRSLVLAKKWDELYNEIKTIKDFITKSNFNIKLKTILSVGDLKSYENVYKASIVAMKAGSDFIKTSTGKETVNATLDYGIVMTKAIDQYYQKTNIKVGIKPAGGIKTISDALSWMILVQNELGDKWLHKNLFRIGASGLLNDLQNHYSQL